MDRNQVRLALLKIVLLALGASTWVFWSFILATRPEDSSPDALATLVRLPASIEAQLPALTPATKLLEPIEMEMVRVPCWDKSTGSEIDTSARWVRLTGKACENSDEVVSVAVRNLTNGFSATVFPTQAKGLTTDYIPLQAGRNDIVIRFDHGQGTTSESQFSFSRE